VLGLPKKFGLDSSSNLNFGFSETITKSTSFTVPRNSCTRNFGFEFGYSRTNLMVVSAFIKHMHLLN
jgi:hypothetical protein